MTNLLHETKEAIAFSHHTDSDIIFIGSEISGHQCSWEQFCKIADMEYDDGYGASQIARDLIIVFKDGAKLWRREYDGSEWWEYSRPFKQPPVVLPIHSVVCSIEKIGWLNLAECNEIEDK